METLQDKGAKYHLFGDVTTEPLTKIRRIIANNVLESWTHIPHVTHHDEVDIGAIEALRHKLNIEHSADVLGVTEEEQIHFTLLPFILKATIEALKLFPAFNASLSDDGETLMLKHYYNLGIAVDTSNGLLVPVIKNVDALTLEELAIASQQLAERTRAGKLTFADTEGGSFTVTSLGPMGGTSFTPIINMPEVAILGVSREITKVVAQNGQIVIRPMLPLSLSYDHRVIDGAMATRFMAQLKQNLSQAETFC
ncbi:2-oxo acid dehydrogenase subunit E2 [Shewanella frigidimarina]|jgi:pyruvate dehydrogenase E2 component (dihydrolipoamide acetyltransferase)|uniref:2-oxo acid dehydrogenase subunit E2 n=1 Tax=Shewanella frigidimarina TaxID=56812 RepID=UPI000F503C2D|nr:2-oxo acid dehydrogenase subunit E2 [Shewanella frigidimarina]RPA32027.1 hypothetical protein EGC78_09865 [Shewanella frigidimarina]|tara:strand:- start:7786 stop:8544 length:759 start_codon:yes stop_codon:yes gene_type:complete